MILLSLNQLMLLFLCYLLSLLQLLLLYFFCVYGMLSAAKGRTSIYTTMRFVSVNQNKVFDTNLVLNTLHNQLNTKKIVYCGLHPNCDVYNLI